MLKTITTAALAAIIASPAAANHVGDLYQHVAQVRAQMRLLDAQTHAVFDSHPRGRILADDIHDELDDLCRDLDRFEVFLRRPIVTRGQLRLLQRYAERIDDQACELHEAVVEALEDAQGRRRGRRVGHHHVQAAYPHARAAYPAPPQRPERLEVYPGITTRAVSLRLGGVNVSFGERPRVAPAPQPYFVGRPAPAYIAAPSHIAAGGCVTSGQAATLLAMADQLRLAAKQLHLCLCD